MVLDDGHDDCYSDHREHQIAKRRHFFDEVYALAQQVTGGRRLRVRLARIGSLQQERQQADERAKAGVFLAFQYPTAIPGVTVANFLRHAVTNVRNPERKEGQDLIPMREFRKEMRQEMDDLGMDQEFARRYLNEGFSGGEKKRAEILQLAMLRPAFAILDETDSGLDIDAVRIVSEGVNRVAAKHTTGVLVITHYERILTYIKPEFVHILFGGRIVEEGGPELVKQLEREGYDWIRSKYPEAARDEDEMEAANPNAGQLV